jgi:hypothetical protein
MPACRQCAELNSDSSTHCVRCGASLASPVAAFKGAQTVLGLQAPSMAPNATAEAAPAPRHLVPRPGAELKQTLMGISGSVPPAPPTVQSAGTPAASTAPAPPFNPKRTLIGGVEMASVSLPPPRTQTTPPTQQSPGTVSATSKHPVAGVSEANSVHSQAANPGTTGVDPGAGGAAVGRASVAPSPDAPVQAAGRTTTIGHSPGVTLPEPRQAATSFHPGGESAPVGNTLLGMPVPNPAYASALDATQLGLPAAWTAQAAALSPLEPDRRQSSAQRTLMGVATPGIAPLNPGKPKSSYPPPPAPASDVLIEMLSVRNPARLKSGKLLLAAAALLLGGLGLFWALWKPAPPLTARIVLNTEGQEVLEVRCADCPEGSRVKLGSSQRGFQQHLALLQLPGPMNMGANALSVALERPGLGRDETVQLSVPVHFRLVQDLSSLSDPNPQLAVQVSAQPGTRVEIDGKPVDLSPGSARVLFEPGDALWGSSAEPEWAERAIAYTVTLAAESPRHGTLKLRAPIAPLLIEAPGPSIVTAGERFVIAGSTLPGGRVSVAGRALNVEPSGKFAQLMSIDAEGQTTIVVRADADQHAPRLVRIEIKRVADLAAEAKQFRLGARSSYSEVLQAAEQGSAAPAAISGVVEEARVVGQTTAVLLDVEQGCPQRPCWLRVLFQQKTTLDKGATVEALGVTQRTVPGPAAGRPVPEVRAAFLLSSTAAPKGPLVEPPPRD